MVEILLTISMLSIILGLMISSFTRAEGAEFVNPIWLYKKYKVNWFGAGVLALIFSIISPPFAFCYWFYKLCTVGRKDE